MPVGQEEVEILKSDLEKEKKKAQEFEIHYRDSRAIVHELKKKISELQSELQDVTNKNSDSESESLKDQIVVLHNKLQLAEDKLSNVMSSPRPPTFNPYNLLSSVPKLEPFSGAQTTQPVRQWVERVQKVTSSVELTEDQKVGLMRLLLTGPAKYTDNQYDDSIKSNFTALCQKLISDFAHTGCTNTAAQLLLKRTQRVDERVAEYGLALIQLYESAFSSPISNEGKSIIRQCFISGLLPNIKAAMQYVSPLPNSLDELIHRAADFEIRWSENSQGVETHRAATLPSVNTVNSDALQTVIQKLGLLSTQMKELHADKLHETRAISKSDSTPHAIGARDKDRASNRANDASGEVDYVRKNQSSHQRITCYRCGKIGHIAIKCRVQLPHEQGYRSEPPAYSARRHDRKYQNGQNTQTQSFSENPKYTKQYFSNTQKPYTAQSLGHARRGGQGPQYSRALELDEIDWPPLHADTSDYDGNIPNQNIFAITEQTQIHNPIYKIPTMNQLPANYPTRATTPARRSRSAHELRRIENKLDAVLALGRYNQALNEYVVSRRNMGKFVEVIGTLPRFVRGVGAIQPFPSALPRLRVARPTGVTSPTKVAVRIILLISGICVGMTSQNAGKFFSCENPIGGHPITLPSAMNCSIQPIEPFRTRTHTFHILAKRSKPVQTKAYKCYNLVNTACTYQSVVFGKAVMSQNERRQAIDDKLCRQAVLELQSCKVNNTMCPIKALGKALYKSDTSTWHSKVPLELQFSWCCKTVCSSKSENIVILEGTIGALSKNNTISDLGDVSHCRLSYGVCTHPEYVIIWDARSDRVCPYVDLGKFIGKSNGKYITIDALQVATQATTQDVTTTKKECEATEDHTLEADYEWLKSEDGWLLLGSNGTYKRSLSQPLHTPYNVNDPLNPKFQYLFDKVHELAKADFEETWKELCRLAEWSLRITRQLMVISPRLGKGIS